MKIENKFFRVRVDKFSQNITSIIFKDLAVAEFQGFSKNITAGGKK